MTGVFLDLHTLPAAKRLKGSIATDARIVVSSPARLGCMTRLAGYLHRHGINRDRVIGNTPDRALAPRRCMSAAVRSGDISTSLAVERVVILDHDRDIAELSPRLVQTTWNDGVLDKSVDRVIAMLIMLPGYAQTLHAAAG
jgi:hypothetical protein